MNQKIKQKDLQTMAERILKKMCPFCGSDDIKVDVIMRKARCGSCNKSMGVEEGKRLLRRAEITI